MYGNADDNTNVTSKLVTESFSKDFINELSRQLTESSNGDIAEKLNDPSTTTKDMLNAILNNNKITDPVSRRAIILITRKYLILFWMISEVDD